LLGYSFAGLVAYEMAQQLMASGEEVPNLVLLDSHLPEWILGFRYRVAQFTRVWKAPTRDVLTFVIRKTREALGHNEQKTSQYQDIAQVAPLEAQRDSTNRDAAATYLLELLSYTGEITLIIAVDRLRNDPLKSPSCGWASYAPKLKVYNVDTDHYKLLTDDPYVSQVAQIVSQKRSSQNH
jgi:thioesterase domain-containing protein